MHCFGCNPSFFQQYIYNWFFCKNCGLLFKEQMNVKKNFLYNESYKWGTKNEKEFLLKSNQASQRFFKYLNIINLNQNKIKKVLDFGSGDGALSYRLKYSKINYQSLEPSISNSQLQYDLGIDCLQGFLSKETFRENTFDIIVANHCLTYIPNLYETFQIFKKILVNKGYVFITVHQFFFSNQIKNLKVLKTHGASVIFSRNSLKNLFKIFNFKILYSKHNINGSEIILQNHVSQNLKLGISTTIKLEKIYLKYFTNIVFNMINFYLKIAQKFKKLLNI